MRCTGGEAPFAGGGAPDRSRDRFPRRRGAPEELVPFHWHGDAFDLPDGAVRLAASERTEHQAFRYGDGGVAYGLLFHRETTSGIVRDMVRAFPDRLELLVMRARTMDVSYRNEEGRERRLRARLSDLFSRDREEFARLATPGGEERVVRLDHLVQVDGIAATRPG